MDKATNTGLFPPSDQLDWSRMAGNKKGLCLYDLMDTAPDGPVIKPKNEPVNPPNQKTPTPYSWKRSVSPFALPEGLYSSSTYTKNDSTSSDGGISLFSNGKAPANDTASQLQCRYGERERGEISPEAMARVQEMSRRLNRMLDAGEPIEEDLSELIAQFPPVPKNKYQKS
ncbi:MAG: hypothetical protein M1829_001044 [Trizodia sp. TS-e1964]|nr:MAG: hypothetical protein M1829_001044 [Trizodia sp. TS-e1964]